MGRTLRANAERLLVLSLRARLSESVDPVEQVRREAFSMGIIAYYPSPPHEGTRNWRDAPMPPDYADLVVLWIGTGAALSLQHLDQDWVRERFATAPREMRDAVEVTFVLDRRGVLPLLLALVGVLSYRKRT